MIERSSIEEAPLDDSSMVESSIEALLPAASIAEATSTQTNSTEALLEASSIDRRAEHLPLGKRVEQMRDERDVLGRSRRAARQQR